MGMIKEKTAYRPTRFESAAAWVVTLASIAALVWVCIRAMTRGA